MISGLEKKPFLHPRSQALPPSRVCLPCLSSVDSGSAVLSGVSGHPGYLLPPLQAGFPRAYWART